MVTFLRSRRIPRAATAGAIAAVMLAAGLGFAPASGAQPATTPTFTWSGKAAASSTNPNPDWSAAGNWKGGVAPTAPGPVNLVFAPVTSTTGPGESDNDLTGLTVAKLTVKSPLSSSCSTSLPYIFGNAITLDGFADTSTGTTGCLPFGQVDLPITIGEAQTWTFNGFGVQMDFSGNISGDFPLTATVAGQALAEFDGSVSVGAFKAIGKDTADTGQNAFLNGSVETESGGSINAGGHPVTVTDVGFNFWYGTAGPLTTKGADLSLSNYGAPYGVYEVDGSATFNPTTYIGFGNLTPGPGSPPKPLAGRDYPQLLVTGGANLGSAPLFVAADCGQPTGTVFTLVDAGAGISGTFTKAPGFGSGSGRIANGAIVQAGYPPDNSCNGAGATPPYLQFNYNDSAGTFTATVVPPPPSGQPKR